MMSNVTGYSHLLSPLKIGAVTVRNRVLVSAHVPGFAVNNLPGEKYIAYHRQYAQAGVGLQITGGTPTHESGLLGIGADSLWNLSDDIIPGYQSLSAAVHSAGGRILAQLAHSAGTVLINQPGRESWAPSPTRSLITGNIAHEMTVAEIEEIVQSFGAGARRAASGNMDGVEILAAFGFLPQAFLSPLTNWRSDEYGGSLDNRLRFLLETLVVVRKAIGDDKILGVRMPGDEYEPGGLTLKDMKVVAQRLATSGLVNYLNITAHTNISHTGRAKHWAPTPAPHGLFVNLAAEIKNVVDIPVFTAGRIIDPKHADTIIAEGKADMVGMTRAHICDPQIVEKIKRRAVNEIRPCVGANNCVANRYAGKPIRCIHNSAIIEPRHINNAFPNKRIVVIGAGPAGLEAGRMAAEAGHKVTIFEKNSYPGGQLAIWANSPSMSELQKIVDWRCSELRRLNVNIRFGRSVGPDELSNMSTDIVIFATGAISHPEPFSGDAKIAVISPHDALQNKEINGSRAMVLSDGRGQAGLAAAEHLLHNGLDVEIVTSDIAVAADLDPTNRISWLQRLGKLGCTYTANVVINSTSANTVNLRDVYSNHASVRKGIDLIIDWRGCRADNALFKHYSGSDFLCYTIGDCVAPRTVEVAIGEAYNIIKAINTQLNIH